MSIILIKSFCDFCGVIAGFGCGAEGFNEGAALLEELPVLNEPEKKSAALSVFAASFFCPISDVFISKPVAITVIWISP